MKRYGTGGLRTAVTIGLILVAAQAILTVGQAATGDLVGNVTFSQDCPFLGTGITYDGTNLWYSCYANQTDLLRADPKTGIVSASYSIEGGLGSIAYDAARNVIWAADGGGNSSPGEIYKIQLDVNKNVVSATPWFTTGFGDPAGIVDGLGFDGTVIPNQLYWSPDTSTTVYVFDINSSSGTFNRSFPWTGTSCYNSGLAIGGNLLFQGSDGCSHVWVVDKNTLAPAFNFSTEVAGDPNFRDEGMTCDPNTFAPINVEWSKEAYNPTRAHAFEIPKGTCAFGGGGVTPPAAKGNVTGGGWIVSPITPAPKNSNKATFGFVAHFIDNSTTPSGNLQYDDKAAGLTAHGNVTKLSVDKTTMIATFSGTAKVNGIDGYAYTVTAVDNGEPGKNDTFAIDIPGIPYSANGTLGGGNIQIHDP